MKQKNNTIAIFSSTWLGVSETFIFRQLKAVEDNGQKSIVLTQKIADSALKEEYEGPVFYKKMDKLTFYYGVLMRKFQFLKNGWFASFGQKRTWSDGLKVNRAKLIHAHYGSSGLRILQTAKTLEIPLVTTFHGNDASAALKLPGYINSLQELFKYSYIITVSDFLKNRLISLGAPKDRIIRHYIGTDLKRFEFNLHESIHLKKSRNEKIKFLQVSNFVEKKGHIYTINAFSRFLNVYSNAELILGGAGKEKAKIEALVKELKIDGKVKFLGAVDPQDVSKLMKECDVFLHHSITAKNGSEEGIPTVIMEALASGILVVSSKHAGIPELIPSNCGFLVEEKNILQYEKTLISLLDTNTEDYTYNAKNHVSKYFDVYKQNIKLIEIYNSIIDGHFENNI